MRASFEPSRLVTSLVALVIVMSSAGAGAQSPDVGAEGRPNPGPFRSIASIDHNSHDLVRPHVFTRPLLETAEAVARAQSPAQSPKQRDSVLNGVLIGAGIGALLGLIPDHYDDCEECHDSLYASIAVGAGVGLVVDLLRSSTRPASRPQSNDRFQMSVAGGRKGVGVRGILRWR
jgi:hypothetical protein